MSSFVLFMPCHGAGNREQPIRFNVHSHIENVEFFRNNIVALPTVVSLS